MRKIFKSIKLVITIILVAAIALGVGIYLIIRSDHPQAQVIKNEFGAIIEGNEWLKEISDTVTFVTEALELDDE